MKKKNLKGSIVRIPMEDGEFCYGRILDGINNVLYDYKSKIENENLNKIIQSDILFAVLSGSLRREDEGCKIIGNIPLDDRHKISPIYFDPDLTNKAIVDFTSEKIKETLKYKTFEKGGLQNGGIYSIEHIKQRLKDYYEGKDYIGITALLKNLEILKQGGNVSK